VRACPVGEIINSERVDFHVWKKVKRAAHITSQFKPIKITIGVFLLIVGVAGLVLPIIPGIVFIVLGLVWLGIVEKEDIKRWVARLTRK